MKKTYVYIGEEEPPQYVPENFVDEAHLVELLEANCRKVGKTMHCPSCEVLTEANHMHDCAHGIPETHMADSERYECVDCGYQMYKIEGEKQGLRFFLD